MEENVIDILKPYLWIYLYILIVNLLLFCKILHDIKFKQFLPSKIFTMLDKLLGRRCLSPMKTAKLSTITSLF